MTTAPPFSPGARVSIDGQGAYRVDSCTPAEGGLWALRLIDVCHDEATVQTVELQQHRDGLWHTESLDVVSLVTAQAATKRGAQGELFGMMGGER